MDLSKPSFFVIILLVSHFSGAQVILEESNLPIIHIDTHGVPIADEPKVGATMKIIDNESGINHVDDDAGGYFGSIGIEFRGSSSQFFFPKKNYGIELWTEAGADTSAVILGMPAEEDWVLYGPFTDKTLVRNLLTFHLWDKTGRYGSRTRLCEVVVKQYFDKYMGVYVMMEKVKRDKERVKISKLTPEENSGDDLTGGYIVKIDKTDGSNSGEGWVSPFLPPGQTRAEQVIAFQFDYPKGRNITPEQAEYIESYVTGFEKALSGINFKDPEKGYRKYINVESFVDFALINELSKNVDGYRLSTFLHKDRDSRGGKLNLGPIWDFNLAFGNADYCEGGVTEGWAWDFNKRCDEDFWLQPFWWKRFLQDEFFVNKLKDRWTELRNGPWSNDKIITYIDSLSTVLEQPAQRNFNKWPILSTYIWPNDFVGDGVYQTEVSYLKEWITGRLAWLDDNIETLDAANIIVGIDGIGTNFRLFPNPSNNTVNLESPEIIKTVKILNLTGSQMIIQENLQETSLHLDISDLAVGTYILSATQLNGVVINRTFVKK